MSTIKQLPVVCSGHTRPVVNLFFSQVTKYGYFLLSACKDGKPMLRQGSTGDWIGTFDGHKGAVYSGTMSSSADLAATGSADFSAKIWNAESGENLETYSHPHIVKSVDFSVDNTQLLTGCNDKKLRIFDYRQDSSREPSLEWKAHGDGLKRALYSRSQSTSDEAPSNIVFSAAADHTVKQWDIRNTSEPLNSRDFTPTQSDLLNVSAPSVDINRSYSGETLLVTHGKSVDVYNMKSFELIKSIDVPCIVACAAFNPAQTHFVCGGLDAKVYKVDYKTSLVQETNSLHSGTVHTVAYSPDGSIFTSGGDEGMIALWQHTVGETYGLWKMTSTEAMQQNGNGVVNGNKSGDDFLQNNDDGNEADGEGSFSKSIEVSS